MTDTTDHEVQASTSSSAMSGKSRPHPVPSKTTPDADALFQALKMRLSH